MAEIRIRRAAAADVEGFVASSVGLFHDDAGRFDDAVDLDWPRKHGAQRFLEGLGDPTRLVLVAVDASDGVVGHLTGVVGDPTAIRTVRVATLLSLYVFGKWRGEGVGSRLVADFRAWAKGQGADRLEVTAYAANAGGLRFYQREGFVAQSVILEERI